MKIILVAGSCGRSRAISFPRWSRLALTVLVLGLPLCAGLAAGYGLGHQQQAEVSDELVETLQQQLQAQQQHLISDRDSSERQLKALAVRMAELQARMVRLDAVSERVAGAAELDPAQLAAAELAVGGPSPEQELAPAQPLADFVTRMDQLQSQLDESEERLLLLDDLLASRQLQRDFMLSGRPVRTGYISSFYGPRSDPFTRRLTQHKGIDFAGKPGSDILSVAAGVVTKATRHRGYGNVVDIRHADGFVTRYAHNQKLLVKAGDVVRKGQVIALMGSSGRSTAPHLHFEVYRHGRSVDPATYLHYAGR